MPQVQREPKKNQKAKGSKKFYDFHSKTHEFTRHGKNTKIYIRDINEKGNVDYVGAILDIILPLMKTTGEMQRNGEISKHYDYFTSIRNCYSHIDYSQSEEKTLHKTKFVVELLQKSFYFLTLISKENKNSGLADRKVKLESIQNTFEVHKTKKKGFMIQNSHLKSKKDFVRVLLLMTGECLSNCTKPSQQSFSKDEKRNLSGSCPYYWLKWASQNKLCHLNGAPLELDILKNSLKNLLDQRNCLFHPSETKSGNKLSPKLCVDALYHLAKVLDDKITLENLRHYQKQLDGPQKHNDQPVRNVEKSPKLQEKLQEKRVEVGKNSLCNLTNFIIIILISIIFVMYMRSLGTLWTLLILCKLKHASNK